ncbi:MAG: TatD family hydrolase [Lachnospiraceae bacterium]|nr:TatD family hydrolase [Lachnospiraceae bacterium]
MEGIIDTHAHYDDEAFDEDRQMLLASLAPAGISKVINVGASLRGCRDSFDLADSHDHIYAALGVHPSETGDLTEDDMDWIAKKAQDKKVVAIGEIGLDYHFPDDPTPEHQQKWFIRQLDLARNLHLPAIIHSRDAAADTLEILKREDFGRIGGVMHCYSYSKELAEEYLKMGVFFGIGGVLTFKNGKKLKEAVAALPMEALLLETDCPYLAPEPNRGKRNSSLYLPLVVEEMSRIKGISREKVIRITSENAQRLFHFSR